MTISTLPTPPATSDPTTFSSRADALIAALPTFVTEVNAAAAAMDVAVTTGPLDAGINAIINGQFRIAQAGTSFAAPGTTAYDLDGWLIAYSTAAVVTVAQAAGSTTGKLCRTVTVTTADTSIAAGDFASQQTKIEGYDAVKYLGNTFTLGFWVKSAVTGTHCVRFYNGTSTYIGTYSIAVANTWEYQTITVTGGFPALASTTNASGINISWTNLCGTTYQTTAGAWNAGNFYGTSAQVNDFATVSNVFALQDVTLNLGTSPAVDSMSYGAELARCQRYRYVLDTVVLDNRHLGAGANQTTGAGWCLTHFPVFMRAAPTVTLVGANQFQVLGSDHGTAVTIALSTANNATALFTYTGSSLVAGGGVLVVASDTPSPYPVVTFSANL